MQIPALLRAWHRPLVVLFAGVVNIAVAHAEIMQTAEYLYIGIEAESYNGKFDRWVLTEPGTATEADDPDGNHSDLASGNAYLELLPDIRVVHADPFGPPDAYWDLPGEGPTADYQIDIPEPGRYYVHIRAYSTGTEDNGIHVGLDGQWPNSGARMQFCTANKRAWWWSSAQRNAGGNGSCGAEKTIYLDVVNAGSHTVSISAREDGFEIDKLVLLKDLSDNTRVCTPTNNTDVSCKNGSIESADGFVDLRVLLSSEVSAAEQEVPVVITAMLENLDGYDVAHNIELTIELDDGLQVLDQDERCTVSNDIVCLLAQQAPTAPNQMESFAFTLQASQAGGLGIKATVAADESDDTPENDVALSSIDFAPGQSLTDLTLNASILESTAQVEKLVTMALLAQNIGAHDAALVQVSFTVPDDMTVNSLPSNCTIGATNVCEIGTLSAGQSVITTVQLLPAASGDMVIAASVDAINDGNSSNNHASVVIIVTVPDGTGSGNAGSGDSATEDPHTEVDGVADNGPVADTDSGAIELWWLLCGICLIQIRRRRFYRR